MSELEDRIAAALPAYGYDPDAEVRAKLAAYLELIVAWNERVRLVGSADPETLVRRHLGESLFLGQVLRMERQRVLDLGSGAGFPGLALALAYPGLNTTLVEADGRKAGFLRAAVQELGVGTWVEVCQARLFKGGQWVGVAPRGAADLVTCRALERMETAPGLVEPLLGAEGVAAFWVSTPRVESWRREYRRWRWREPVGIPGSERRVIVVGSCSA